MPTLIFRFPAGRYHATPWGSHVNEGAVEWPPSPWRLLRAFLSVGFTKLHWEKDVPGAGQQLIYTLAGVLPVYRLPRTDGGHCRHFMPIRKGKGETRTKIFDTFYRLDPKDELLVHYPVNLEEEQKTLLKNLLAHLNYLGRAESWVEARLLSEDVVVDDAWCIPDQPPPPGGDQVSLITPMNPDDYMAWRTRSLELAQKRKQEQTGKKLTKAQVRRLEQLYPGDLIQCLCTDTGLLQKQGWSQPPGSRRVIYSRPAGTAESRPVLHLGAPPRAGENPTCILLALSGDNISGSLRPLMHRCLPQAELIHRALLGRIGNGACPALSGRSADDGTVLRGHGHVHYIPLDLDGDGRIDYYLLHAPMGFDRAARDAVFSLRATYAKDIERVVVSCSGTGSLDDVRAQLRDRSGRVPGCLGSGRVWESSTPFIAPLFMKKNRTKYKPKDQVRRSCLERGLPEPISITQLKEKHSKFLRFVRRRRDKAKAPPSSWPYAWRLEFAQPVSGLLTLGYASHFGLGLFAVAGE